MRKEVAVNLRQLAGDGGLIELAKVLPEKHPNTKKFLELADSYSAVTGVDWSGAYATFRSGDKLVDIRYMLSPSTNLAVTPISKGMIVVLSEDKYGYNHVVAEYEANDKNIIPAFNFAEEYLAKLNSEYV